MRRLLTILALDRAAATRAADTIASLAGDWRSFAQALAMAATLVIALPALILFIATIGGLL